MGVVGHALVASEEFFGRLVGRDGQGRAYTYSTFARKRQAMIDDERKEYLDERRAAIKEGRLSSDLCDKSIFVVAGVALAKLSMIFLRHAMSPLLIGGWIFLMIGIVALLASLFTSRCAWSKKVDQVDQAYIDPTTETKKNKLDSITIPLNWIGLFAVLLGMFFVVVAVIRAGG
jgi:hypothetical protein